MKIGPVLDALVKGARILVAVVEAAAIVRAARKRPGSIDRRDLR